MWKLMVNGCINWLVILRVLMNIIKIWKLFGIVKYILLMIEYI